MSPPEPRSEIGTFCLVLHSHLPWLAHHGSWPVGEEWLYQSWAASYIPVLNVLSRLADEGRQELVTLGMTPVLAAQLDDPYCGREFHTWLGFWQERAHQLAAEPDPSLRELGAYESQLARAVTSLFERDWRHGGSAVIRPLVDSAAIELIGGPATHPFLPLLDDEVAAYTIDAGLRDTALRLGRRPAGIWAPECGYRPGLELSYSDAGITHCLLDGPALLHVGRSTSDAWTIGDSDVVALGRDLEVTYRVWSPRRGYPGGSWYRDFHAFHRESGTRHKRVTSTRTPADRKAFYDPDAARKALEADAADFVSVVRKRLLELAKRRGKPGLVVAAYDTELFGHWWHEGPVWLDRILRLLPEAGVRITTLEGAIARGGVAGSVLPAKSSWGSGKDWSVWAGDAVSGIVNDNDALQRRWRKVAAAAQTSVEGVATRRPALDQLARCALLALSSDWAFMITKDSAAGSAADRHNGHHRQFHMLATLLELTYDGDAAAAAALVERVTEVRRTDGPFGGIDGRLASGA